MHEIWVASELEPSDGHAPSNTQEKEFVDQSFEFPRPFLDCHSDFWEPETTAQMSHTCIQDT